MAFPLAVLAAPMALAATALLSRAMCRWAPRLGLVDAPDPRKPQRVPVPIGGPALILGSVAGSLPFMPPSPEALFGWAGALGVALLGLADDRRPLPPGVKLLGQTVVALIPVLMGGVVVRSVDLFGLEIGLGALAWPLTLLWLVGITNAFNLVDGLDGLAGGQAVALSLAAAIASAQTGSEAVLATSLGLLGAAAAFTPFNLHPARLFMGDGGSYFLGFALALAVPGSLGGGWGGAERVPLEVLLLWFAYPVADTLGAIGRRARAGRSILQADRAHLHHRLLARVGDHRRTVWGFYGLFSALTALGLLLLFACG